MENKKKQALSVEQMQKLQSLGVDTSSASAVWQSGSDTGHEWTLRFVGYMDNHLREKVFAFTLQDIIDLLPATIDHFNLNIDKNSIGYIDPRRDYKDGDDVLIGFTAETSGSLIDAAYLLMQWMIVYNISKATKILDLSKSHIANTEAKDRRFLEELLLFGKVSWKNEEKTEIRKEIENIIIKKYPYLDDKTDIDKLFSEVGLDSLDRVELAMRIEKKFDISIPDDLLGTINTIEDAVNVVYRLKKGE